MQLPIDDDSIIGVYISMELNLEKLTYYIICENVYCKSYIMFS